MAFDRNGWYPNVFVDGDRVWISYGNGVCRLWEGHLEPSGTVTEVRQEIIGAAGCWAGQWIEPFVVAFWRERADVGRDVWELLAVDVRGPWTPIVRQGPSARVGGNFFAAADGHAVGVNQGIAALDAVAMGPGGNGAATGGGVMVFPSVPDGSVVVATAPGQSVSYPALTGLHQLAAGPDGRVAYGGFGPVRGILDGHDTDLTVTPWRQEFLGSGGTPELGRSIWRHQDGSIWLATSTFHSSFTGLLLRPWGDQACVQVSMNANYFSVSESDNCWVIASCDETGNAAVSTVPFSTPRRPVTTTPTDPPPPDPEPEPDPMPEPASLFADLQAERAKYPATLTRDQPGKILNAVAWKHREAGWGLSVKPNGNNVPSPQGPLVAYDILHNRLNDTLYDVATAEWPTMRITWSQTTHHNQPDRPWLAPIQPTGEEPQPEPEPEPDPQPGPDIVAAFNQRMDAHEALLADEFVKVYRELELIRNGVQAVIDKPVPVPTVTFPKYKSQRVPVIGTLRLTPEP